MNKVSKNITLQKILEEEIPECFLARILSELQVELMKKTMSHLMDYINAFNNRHHEAPLERIRKQKIYLISTTV